MLMTEKEASEKTCVQSVGSNRAGRIIGCDGSNCMAWRWANVYETIAAHPGTATVEPPLPPHVPIGYEFVPYKKGARVKAHWRPTEETLAVRQGFCGLAGVPVATR